jgi:hypothetical protein
MVILNERVFDSLQLGLASFISSFLPPCSFSSSSLFYYFSAELIFSFKISLKMEFSHIVFRMHNVPPTVLDSYVSMFDSKKPGAIASSSNYGHDDGTFSPYPNGDILFCIVKCINKYPVTRIHVWEGMLVLSTEFCWMLLYHSFNIYDSMALQIFLQINFNTILTNSKIGKNV